MRTKIPEFPEPNPEQNKEIKENPNNFFISGMLEGVENQNEEVGYFVRDSHRSVRFVSTSKFAKILFSGRDYLSGKVKIEPDGVIYIYPDNPPYLMTIAEIEWKQPANRNLKPRPTLTLAINLNTDHSWLLEENVYKELQEWLKK